MGSRRCMELYSNLVIYLLHLVSSFDTPMLFTLMIRNYFCITSVVCCCLWTSKIGFCFFLFKSQATGKHRGKWYWTETLSLIIKSIYFLTRSFFSVVKVPSLQQVSMYNTDITCNVGIKNQFTYLPLPETDTEETGNWLLINTT